MKRTIVLLATLLLSFGLINAQNQVDLGFTTVDTDTLRTRGVPIALDIYMANDYVLGGMSLGFEVWSPDGACWDWQPLGTHGASLIVSSGYGRMGDGSVFDMTGLLVTEQDINELSDPNDVIMCGGVALAQGMPTGPLEHQYSYHFTACGDGGDDAWVGTLCFDSTFVPPSGAFVFVDPFGAATPPQVLWMQGGLCKPVAPPRNFCPEFDDPGPTNVTMYWSDPPASVTLTATDPEGDDLVWTDGPTVTHQANCQEVGTTVTYNVYVSDAYHNATECDMHVVNFTIENHPPVITNCPTAMLFVGKGNTITYDFNSSDADGVPPDVHTWSTAGPGSIDPGTGMWSWTTTDLDVGINDICVEVTDCAGAMDTCCFQVEVLSVEPWMIKIEKVHDALQGHFVDVDICINKGSEAMGGFDFLIAYDASALAFTEATLSDWLIGCGWEYFTYRFNWNGNCGNACPSGLLRLVGMAETNNGPNHPDMECVKAFQPGVDCYDCGGIIATLTFFLSNDRTLECMFVPVRFYWMDCGDNVISTIGGDTLAVSRFVYDYVGCSYHEIQDPTYGFPGWFGAPDYCLVGDKVTPIRFVDFCNGGVDIVCADSIDARGDINVNGVSNEIADAVMFTNYFISGLSAFGTHVEASIAASDVNADGIALSVADLVYLVRVIVGDANPYPKPLPETPVAINAQGGVVNYDSPVDLGAALLTFQVNGNAGTPQLGSGASGMDMKYAQEGNELRVLIYNIGSEMIEAGANVLVTVPGEVELTGAEVATFDGFGVDALVRNLPMSFAVNNYPNPFNPSTKIALSLPVASEWSVKIFNITGQLVKDYSGYSEAGTVEVMWNGTDASNNKVASGIYFYKAEAGQYNATKKMLLMK